MNASILNHSTDTRGLQGWLEDWHAKNKYGTLIDAFVYFLASLLAFCFGMALVGYILAVYGGRASSAGQEGSGMIFGATVAFVFMACGTIFQMLIHNRNKIRLQFNKTVLYYAGYRSIADKPSQLIGDSSEDNRGWRSLTNFGETTEGKIATFPGWLFMKGYESLVHFKQTMSVDLAEAAQVLAYMVVKDTRCFPPELEDEFPRINVPRATAFLLQFSGVSAFDAHTPGIVVGHDRIEIWLPLID
ncbi:MAG: hypothetical protein V3V10_10670 [Planctomycetota bacterium]